MIIIVSIAVVIVNSKPISEIGYCQVSTLKFSQYASELFLVMFTEFIQSVLLETLIEPGQNLRFET